MGRRGGGCVEGCWEAQGGVPRDALEDMKGGGGMC